MKKFLTLILSSAMCLNWSFLPVLAEEEVPLEDSEAVEELPDGSSETKTEIIVQEAPDEENPETPDQNSSEDVEDEKETVELIFDKNAEDVTGEMQSQVIDIGQETELVFNQFKKDGWYFTCWNTERDGTGISYLDAQPIMIEMSETTQIILYAQWEEEREATELSVSESDFAYEENNDGTVTITGYKSSADCVDIPSAIKGKKVTKIGKAAFKHNKDIKTVTLPDTVTSIGESAFSFSSLISIKISDSVASIEYQAFLECNALEEITVDENNKIFDSRDNCNAVIRTENNELIIACKTTVIPNSVTSIGVEAYCGNRGVTSVTIPEGVTEIKDSAFVFCFNLEHVSIPNSVQKIGSYAFGACNIKDIRLPVGLKRIEEGTFSDAGAIFNGLKHITIPNTVTSFGADAFRGCMDLEIIYLGTKKEWDNLCKTIANEGGNEDFLEAIREKYWTVTFKPDGASVDSNLTLKLQEEGTLYSSRGFSVSWNEVQNAASYTVEVLDTGDKVCSTEKVSAPKTECLISKLKPGKYKVRVFVALKNGTKTGYSNEIAVTVEQDYSIKLHNNESGKTQTMLYAQSDLPLTIEKLPDTETSYFVGWTGMDIDKSTHLINPVKEIKIPKGTQKNLEYYGHFIAKNIIFTSEGIDRLDKSLDECVNKLLPQTYDTKLARILAGLSNAAYDEEKCAKSLLSFGFHPRTFFYDKGENYDHKENYVGITAGLKTLDDDTNIIVIACRGSSGTPLLSSDWMSNYKVADNVYDGNLTYHYGFESAALNAYREIHSCYGDIIRKQNTKIVITGHSRGAAVANLLEQMIASKFIAYNRVYGYNFAVPRVAEASMYVNELPASYIHNINNFFDVVPCVPYALVTSMFGGRWLRYGKDYTFMHPGNKDPLSAMVLEGEFMERHMMKTYWEWAKWELMPTFDSSESLYDFDMFGIRKSVETQTFKEINTAIELASKGIHLLGKLFSVKCPVDVVLKDANGNKILEISDNRETYFNGYEDHVFVWVDHDQKYIYCDNTVNPIVELLATDSGKLDYSYTVYEKSDIKTFTNIELEEGKRFKSDVSGDIQTENVELKLVNETGDTVADVLTDGTEVWDGLEDLYVVGLRKHYNFTGTAVKPRIQVYDSGKLLKEKTDYAISIKNNTKAGQATLIITGKGEYTSKKEMNFTIDPVDIDKSSVEAITLVQSSSPKKLTVKPKVSFNGKSLKEKTDYTIDYNGWDQMTSGDHEILLKGEGNFQGEKKLTVSVVSLDKDIVPVTKLKVSAKAVNYADIKDKENLFAAILNQSGFTVMDGKNEIHRDEAYEIPENSITNCDRAGTCTFVIKGMTKKYQGERTVSIKINGTAISKAKATGTVSYTGDRIEIDGTALKLTIADGKETKMLEEHMDYEIVSYENNINAGKAIAFVEGLGAYSGTGKVTFTINPNATKKDNMVTIDDAVYTKGGAKPKVTVTGLREDVDYKVTYKNDTKNYKVTVTLKFQGNYKGTPDVSRTLTVSKKKLEEVYVSSADVLWKNKAGNFIPKITLIDSDGKKLAAGTDYEKEIIYCDESGNQITDLKAIYDAGSEITAVLTGKGSYTGSKSVKYRLLADKTDISKASFKIKDQEFTGEEIELEADDFTQAQINKTDIKLGKDFEIVCYENNIKKGTAKVTLHGKEEKGLGGYKTVSFKIVQRDMSAHWEDAARRLAQAFGF